MQFVSRICGATMLLAAVAVASGQELQTQYTRLALVSFDPALASQGNQRLYAYAGWFNPATEVFDYMDGMETGSNGLVKERLVTFLDMNFYPVKNDGFQYSEAEYLNCLSTWTGWHDPDGVDYAIIVRDYDFARKVDRGEVDEVAIYGAPYFGYWESTMCGYGGYWCNSGPQQRMACSKIFIVMGWNYERVVSLHATGHRTESIMSEVYDGWNVNGDRTLWDRFGWNIGQTTISNIYGVGSAHLPANGADHYDYANTQTVECYAPAWMNDFPTFNGKNGQTALVNRETWGSGPTNNYELEYFKWWYSHMPHVAGSNTHDGYDRLNNWWEYIFNFNEHPESGGDHAKGGTAPPAVPLGAAITAVTNNTRCDWTPQINSSGRMVWKQFDQGIYRWLVRSANVDGSDQVQLGPVWFDVENVNINDANQVVWQAFDGYDFEIYTANADGTGYTRVTDNAVNDWHPDISNTGRIVWDRWDGEDYEICSSDIDGSNLVQITNNAYSGTGKRPDDCWPRINNSDRVVWMGHDGTNFEIYSANADGTGLTQITSGYYQNEFPQISDGGKVVWHAWHTDANAEVYSANATGGSVQRLSTNSVNDWWPQVNTAGDVVWMQRSGADWEIVLNGAYITNNGTHDQLPVIDDSGRIVWQGFDGNDWEVYVYDGGTIYQLTDNDYDDQAPYTVAGQDIVWHGESAIGDPEAPGYYGPTTEVFSASNEDTMPPTLESASSVGNPNRVTVSFSEPLEPTGAENLANYAIDHGVTISDAALQIDNMTVVLTTSTLSSGVTYTLTVNNLEDLSGNVITPGTNTSFEYAPAQRVTDGLVVLYDFGEGVGTTVNDVSGVGTPMNLTINDAGSVTWTDGGLRFDATARAATDSSAVKLVDACMATDEITMEAWVVPTNAAQSGPAPLMTCSPHANSRNCTLSHGPLSGGSDSAYSARVRTTTTTDNGEPGLETAAGLAQNALQHVVYTRDSFGNAKLYVDGAQAATGTTGGDFSTWANNYRFVLANEYSLAVPWLGEFKLAAVYNKALTLGEVEQNYYAGTGDAPQYATGDLNCDGVVDLFDVDPFVLALTTAANTPPFAGYSAVWPDCDPLLADIDNDGEVTLFDIDPFVDLLTGG